MRVLKQKVEECNTSNKEVLKKTSVKKDKLSLHNVPHGVMHTKKACHNNNGRNTNIRKIISLNLVADVLTLAFTTRYKILHICVN